MKRNVFFSLLLISCFAVVFSSCNKDSKVEPTTAQQTFVIGEETFNIKAATAISYDDDDDEVIVLTTKDLTDYNNNAVCIIFDDGIVPGSYELSSSKAQDNITIYALEEVSLAELPVLIEDGTIYNGKLYKCSSGTLVITQHGSTYSVILVNCSAIYSGSSSKYNVAVNYEGTFDNITMSDNNEFTISNKKYQIGMASILDLSSLMPDSLSQYSQYVINCMAFFSSNYKQVFLIAGEGEMADGTYSLSSLGKFPTAFIITDFDLTGQTWDTGYMGINGTFTLSTNNDKTRSITIKDALFMNVEHPTSIISGSLNYKGLMFGIQF